MTAANHNSRMNPIQLAIQHFNEGRPADAENIARAVLQSDPASVVACHLLGVIALRTNRPREAVAHLTRAVEIAPRYPDVYRDLANAYGATGRGDLAIETCRRLLAIRPDDANAQHALGNALAASGRFMEAKAAFQRAVELNPAFANAACDLATAMGETGDMRGAGQWYRRAVELNPALDIAQAGLARSLAYAGDSNGALRTLCAALARLPASFILRRSLSELVDGYPLPDAGARERRILLDLLEDLDIPSQSLSVAVADTIAASEAYRAIEHAVFESEDVGAALLRSDLPRDPLLLAALPRLLFQSLAMERVFTAIRRACLFSAGKQLPLPFLCALAQHCLLAEYVWPVEENEQARLAGIVATVEPPLQGVAPDPVALEPALACVALYRPLYPWWSAGGDARALAALNWSPSFAALVRSQILDTLHEKALADRIPCLTEVSDETSIAVKQQYEHNPYPRWMDCKRPAPGSFAIIAAQWRPGEPVPAMPEPLPVLDAGCGTGHSPVQAARLYRGCRVTAVDISTASLGYAARMAQNYGVDNIDFRCGDILKLGALDARFAIILCGGVLHHLERPLEGWRVLTGLLAEGGLMRIALYSTRARTNVAAARALLAAAIVPGMTLEDIRRCRQAVLDLPDDHPAKSLVYSSDFRSSSGFRDLVLHAREHTFTLPQIGAMLGELGLRFLGFELTPEVLGAFKQRYPATGSEKDLALWDAFEREHPNLFAGMYQFWCSR